MTLILVAARFGTVKPILQTVLKKIPRVRRFIRNPWMTVGFPWDLLKFNFPIMLVAVVSQNHS